LSLSFSPHLWTPKAYTLTLCIPKTHPNKAKNQIPCTPKSIHPHRNDYPNSFRTGVKRNTNSVFLFLTKRIVDSVFQKTETEYKLRFGFFFNETDCGIHFPESWNGTHNPFSFLIFDFSWNGSWKPSPRLLKRNTQSISCSDRHNIHKSWPNHRCFIVCWQRCWKVLKCSYSIHGCPHRLWQRYFHCYTSLQNHTTLSHNNSNHHSCSECNSFNNSLHWLPPYKALTPKNTLQEFH